jgi:hypothetical protein
MNVDWRPRLLAGALAVAAVLACSAPPKKIQFERLPDNTIKATAEWDDRVITIQGIENALSKAMAKLREAQQSGNAEHAAAWQKIVDRCLQLKSESMQTPPSPSPAPSPAPAPSPSTLPKSSTAMYAWIGEGVLLSTAPAYIRRPTLREAMDAYLAYEDGFIADVQEALDAGIPESDLEAVKAALLY